MKQLTKYILIGAIRGADELAKDVREAIAKELERLWASEDKRGYALMGSGNYMLDCAKGANGYPALIVSLATEEQKKGRVVGDTRKNEPGRMIQPEDMVVYLEFKSLAGLAALEQQLSFLREEQF